MKRDARRGISILGDYGRAVHPDLSSVSRPARSDARAGLSETVRSGGGYRGLLSGSAMVNVLPLPGPLLVAQRRPPWARTMPWLM